MADNKLISMVEYVLAQHEINKFRSDTSFFNGVINYANFLKQPIELWQFIPCKLVDGKYISYESYFTHGGNKNTICEPYEGLFEIKPNVKCKEKKHLDPDKTRYYDSIAYKNAEKEYQEAKERVLFEGFELKRHLPKENPLYFLEDKNGKQITFHIGLYTFGSKDGNFVRTIEDLAKYNLTLKIEIAQKLNL